MPSSPKLILNSLPSSITTSPIKELTPVKGADESPVFFNNSQDIFYLYKDVSIVPHVKLFYKTLSKLLIRDILSSTKQTPKVCKLFNYTSLRTSTTYKTPAILPLTNLASILSKKHSSKTKLQELKELSYKEQVSLGKRYLPTDYTTLHNLLTPHYKRISPLLPTHLTTGTLSTILPRLLQDIKHSSGYELNLLFHFYIFLSSHSLFLAPFNLNFTLFQYTGAPSHYLKRTIISGLPPVASNFFLERYKLFGTLFPKLNLTHKEWVSQNNVFNRALHRTTQTILTSSNISSLPNLPEEILTALKPHCGNFIRNNRPSFNSYLLSMFNTLEAVYRSSSKHANTITLDTPNAIVSYWTTNFPLVLKSPYYKDLLKYIEINSQSRYKDLSYRLKFFFNFLTNKATTSLPDFLTIERKQCSLFSDYLSVNHPTLQLSTLNSIINEAEKFLSYLYKIHSIHKPTPINLSIDKFNLSAKQPFTSRETIPLHILTLLKELITKDDYAFPKTLKKDYVKALDRKTNTIVHVWNPVSAIALYTLLTLNLRTIGVRFLDSGELDEYLVDLPTLTHIPNPNPNKVKNRQEGMFKLLSKLSPILGLHVQPHKLHAAHDIPFIPPSLIEQLTFLKEWQQRYGSDPQIINISDDPSSNTNNSIRHRTSLASIVPLFRDLNRPTGYHQFPVKDNKLAQFLNLLAVELNRLHPELHITKQNPSGPVANFDKHTLRVSINTHLQYVGGLPIQDAQSILNHATPIMTLHYTKPTPDQLHTHLKSAYSKLSEALPTTTQEYKDSPSSFIHNSASAQSHAELTKDKNTLWKFDMSGICPGASCHTGYLDDKNQPQAVPGQRCALCRYRITGPQFLAGLTLEANNLMFKLKQYIKKLKELNSSLLDAEDTNDTTLICQLNNEIQTLHGIHNLDWQEWTALFKIIDDCNNMLASSSSSEPTSLQPISKPSIQLEAGTEFELMHNITTGMELYNISSKIQNNEAALLKHELINELLLQINNDSGLLSLPKETRLKAGNLLSSFIINCIPQTDLYELMSGAKPVSSYPVLQKLLPEMLRIKQNTLAKQENKQHNYLTD